MESRRPTTGSSRRGPRSYLRFTVLEIVLWATLLGALAVSLEPLDQSRAILANEARAVRFLERVSAAQEGFLVRSGGVTYAFLDELLGEPVGRSGIQVEPGLIPTDLIRRLQGTVSVEGYHVIVYLPDGQGGGAALPLAAGPTNAGARFWIAYAWPRVHGKTGRRVFAIALGTPVLASDHAIEPFSGPGDPPPPNLARGAIPDLPFPLPPASILSRKWTPADRP
jgi:hypothetical protein